MSEDNSTRLPRDQQHDRAKSFARLGRLLTRPRAAAVLVLLTVVGVSGAFGLRSALSATSLPSNFQSAAQTTYFYPTATTCQSFSSTTAQGPIQYGVSKSVIGQTDPGVFYFWVKVTNTSTFTLTETQSGLATANPEDFFTIASGSAVYDANCNKVATIDASNVTRNGNLSYTITVPNLSAGTTYFVGIKFNTSSIVGDKPPTGTCTSGPSKCATYTFTWKGGGFSGGIGTLALVPKK